MMRVVPLAAVPSQTLDIVLDAQSAQIGLRQNGPALYFDLRLNDQPIVTTRICRDTQLLLLDARYRGFLGDFFFVDLQGSQDPEFTGLGPDGRYVLAYLSEDELP